MAAPRTQEPHWVAGLWEEAVTEDGHGPRRRGAVRGARCVEGPGASLPSPCAALPTPPGPPTGALGTALLGFTGLRCAGRIDSFIGGVWRWLWGQRQSKMRGQQVVRDKSTRGVSVLGWTSPERSGKQLVNGRKAGRSLLFVSADFSSTSLQIV